jgi:hypothetical protein
LKRSLYNILVYRLCGLATHHNKTNWPFLTVWLNNNGMFRPSWGNFLSSVNTSHHQKNLNNFLYLSRPRAYLTCVFLLWLWWWISTKEIFSNIFSTSLSWEINSAFVLNRSSIQCLFPTSVNNVSME